MMLRDYFVTLFAKAMRERICVNFLQMAVPVIAMNFITRLARYAAKPHNFICFHSLVINQSL